MDNKKTVNSKGLTVLENEPDYSASTEPEQIHSQNGEHREILENREFL